MDPKLAVAHIPKSEYFEYKTRDTIVYALGIGARAKEDIRYLYENHEDFTVFPSYIVAPGLTSSSVGDWPGVVFDLTRILHGEQYIEIYKPLPSEGRLRMETRVVDILDKGKGALILSNVTAYDAYTNEKVSMQQIATFQAALYRMGSLDLNPLHIDPNFAAVSGFDQPILHGLCSFGFSLRHVLQAFADNDANRLRAIKVRFSAPVLPGQTLCTEMWHEGDKIIFQTKVKETGKIVIANAWARLDNLTSTAETKSSGPAAMTLKSAALFDQIKAEIPNHKEKVRQVKGIIQYELTSGGKVVGKYTIDLKNGDGTVYEGEAKEKASVTVTVDDEDFVKIAAGELEPTKAFMQGKIKAKGNIMMLQKLQGILQNAQKAKL